MSLCKTTRQQIRTAARTSSCCQQIVVHFAIAELRWLQLIVLLIGMKKQRNKKFQSSECGGRAVAYWTLCRCQVGHGALLVSTLAATSALSQLHTVTRAHVCMYASSLPPLSAHHLKTGLAFSYGFCGFENCSQFNFMFDCVHTNCFTPSLPHTFPLKSLLVFFL